MNKSVLNELKASYKKVVEEIIKRHLQDGFTIKEVRSQLITGENIAITGLNQKIESLNNSQLRESDKEVLKNEIYVLIELLNKYCLVKKLNIGSAKYNGEMKSYSYIITYEYRLLTREEGYLNYGLTDNAIDYSDFKVNNKKVKSFTVDLEHELFLAIEEIAPEKITKAPKEKNYKKICSFIIAKYGDKEKYFFLDELMKELKKLFKVTQKEFKEIILNMLIDQNKINLRRIELSGHKYLRFYKNGIYYSVDRFIIPKGVFQNTFKA